MLSHPYHPSLSLPQFSTVAVLSQRSSNFRICAPSTLRTFVTQFCAKQAHSSNLFVKVGVVYNSTSVLFLRLDFPVFFRLSLPLPFLQGSLLQLWLEGSPTGALVDPTNVHVDGSISSCVRKAPSAPSCISFAQLWWDMLEEHVPLVPSQLCLHRSSTNVVFGTAVTALR